MYVCVNVCMYVCMHVCVYVCVSVHTMLDPYVKTVMVSAH